MSRDASARRGFTLIEILIVVVIAGMMAAIAVPGFTRAMKGAELRSAARTLAMAHKFARNTAVLRQTPMALLVDTQARMIEVLSLTSRNSMHLRGGFLGQHRVRWVVPDRRRAVPGFRAHAPQAQLASQLIKVQPIGRKPHHFSRHKKRLAPKRVAAAWRGFGSGHSRLFQDEATARHVEPLADHQC